MPNIYELNPPPHPLFDFINGFENHPWFAARGFPARNAATAPANVEEREQQQQATQAQTEKDSTTAPAEKTKGKNTDVEDPPEVDPATIRPNRREMPFRGRGMWGRHDDNDDEPRRKHPCRGRFRPGPTMNDEEDFPWAYGPFGFGGRGPWWASRGGPPHEHPWAGREGPEGGPASPPPPPPGPHGFGHHPRGPPPHGGPHHHHPPPPGPHGPSPPTGFGPPPPPGPHGPPPPGHHGPPPPPGSHGPPPPPGPHDGPHRGHHHHHPPPPGAHGFHARHGPHGPRGFRGPHDRPSHWAGREGDAAGFDVPPFLKNLGERLGVDLSGAAAGLNRFTGPRGNRDNDFEPRADIFDTENLFIIHTSLPGAKKEDVGVDWDSEKSHLRIAGVVHRPAVDEELMSKLVVDGRKREVGAFEKIIRLGTKNDPASIDVAGITAKMTDGVLVVKVPKVAVDRQRREVPIDQSVSPSPVRDIEKDKENDLIFDANEYDYDSLAKPTTDKEVQMSEHDYTPHDYSEKMDYHDDQTQHGEDDRSATVDIEDRLPHYTPPAHEEKEGEESDWEKYNSDEEGEYVKINVD